MCLTNQQCDELRDFLDAIQALADVLTLDPNLKIDRTALAMLIKQQVEQAIRITRTVN